MRLRAIDEPFANPICGWIERENVARELAAEHPFCESPLHGEELVPADWIVLFLAKGRDDYIAGKCFLCMREFAMDMGFSHPAKGSLALEKPGEPDIPQADDL